MKNHFKYTRQDKRQAIREGDSIQAKFEAITNAFEEVLFSDNCPESVFEDFNLQWLNISAAYKKGSDRVSRINPRAFHDYSISHSEHIYDTEIVEFPQYIKPLFII